MRQKQTGFGHVLLIAGIAAVVLVGFLIWRVVAASNTKDTPTASVDTATGQSTNPQAAKPADKDSDKNPAQPAAKQPTTGATVIEPSTSPQTERALADKLVTKCAGQPSKVVDGKTYCTYTVTIKDLPSQLTTWVAQTNPSRLRLSNEIKFKGYCTPHDACQEFHSGAPITSNDTSQIDWKITKEAAIEIAAPESWSNYEFMTFDYFHTVDKNCSGGYYCDVVDLQFKKN